VRILALQIEVSKVDAAVKALQVLIKVTVPALEQWKWW
jgi:hypothetical protein